MSDKHIKTMIEAAINKKPLAFKEAFYTHMAEKKKEELSFSRFREGNRALKDSGK